MFPVLDRDLAIDDYGLDALWVRFCILPVGTVNCSLRINDADVRSKAWL